MVLLGWSRISRWPRYLVLITGPRQTISIDCEICETNHSYRGRELVTARPSSTCTGMIRKSGAPDAGRGITLYRTIRFKERIQCIGPSKFTGPRESVNVIPNWEECITGNYWAYYTHRVALGDAAHDAGTKLLHRKCRMSTMPVPIGGRKMWGIESLSYYLPASRIQYSLVNKVDGL